MWEYAYGESEVRHLSKLFNGVPAVEDVGFKVQPGAILGCIGK